MILRPLRFVHPVLQRTQTELKTQKKNYADVASCKFFARHLCRSSARKQSIWRVFQTGGYAVFSSICLSCFGLRIVFHYGPAYPMENASALPSPRFEMLSRVHPELRRASTSRGDDQHGLRGVDDQPSGQQTIRQEAADAVDAAWGPSFAADQDEGAQRGSGRGIPPLVSEIQAATTNAGTRAQGGLTPDLLRHYP